MKTFLTLSFILVAMIGMTQITITQSDFAAPGDTAMVSFSDETTLDLVTTGANAIWDYSTINITSQTIDTFFDVADAPFLYQAVFNNSWTDPEHLSDWYRPWGGGGLSNAGTFGISIGNPVQFTAVESNQVVNTGVGFEIMGQGIPGGSDTTDVQYVLPMNYSDSWNGSSYTVIDLNPAFDAIYTRHQWRSSVVDGWGQITTPWGTFDALRVKSDITSEDSLYVGQFSFWANLPVPDQHEYHWFTNGQKEPVFSVTTSDVGGNETITEIKFRDKKRDFASTEEFPAKIAVYPNPAEDFIQVNLNSEVTEVKVYDLTGKLVFAERPGANQFKIHIADWDAGVYIIEAIQVSGILTTRISVR